jgi:hypothetical protein
MKRPPKEFEAELYSTSRTRRSLVSDLPVWKPKRTSEDDQAYLVDHADQAETDDPSFSKLGLLPFNVGDNQVRNESMKDRVLGQRLPREMRND